MEFNISPRNMKSIRSQRPPNQSMDASERESYQRRQDLKNDLMDFDLGGGEPARDPFENGLSNILVAVRLRPLNSREMAVSNLETVKILDRKVVSIIDPQLELENDYLRNKRNKERNFEFDFAFDQSDPTETVFDNTTKLLIPGVLSGYNATIFAYGATGAGKTFTMLGDESNMGIMPLMMSELFRRIETRPNPEQFIVKISYLEVYNETLRDLLSREDSILDIREDPDKGIVVAGTTELITQNTTEVLGVLKVGNRNRTMEATGANQFSSRSHAVLQVTVEHRSLAMGIKEEILTSKLSLIDLAGSERAAATKNKGLRMIEGANINKSLLTLGTCIKILAERSDKGNMKGHIPYRDSKLTRLLKDSLGGNCRTVMVACISPYSASFEDTHNTLKYANTAKNIKTNAFKNVLNSETNLANYKEIISNLKTENEKLKKLLQNQKEIPQQQISPLKTHESFLNDIKHHFEEEVKLKKVLFDLEISDDENNENLSNLMIELRFKEDMITKDKIEDCNHKHKSLMNQLNDFAIQYNKLASRRNFFINKIKQEHNKEVYSLLMSVYSQNEMIVVKNFQNLEFQQKEKRADLQVKAKDRQIKNLQHQLARERNTQKPLDSKGATSEINHTQQSYNHGSNSHSTHIYTNSTNAASTRMRNTQESLNDKKYKKNMYIDDANSYDLLFDNTKEILSSGTRKAKFPNSVSHAVLSKVSSNSLAAYNLKSPTESGQTPINKNVNNSYQSKFLAKRQQFISDRYDPLDPRMPGQPINKQSPPHSSNTGEIKLNQVQTPKFIKPMLRPAEKMVIKKSPKKGGQNNISMTDDVDRILVTETSNSVPATSASGKKNILQGLNDRNANKLPVLEKNKYNSHGHLALRYGESPFVGRYNKMVLETERKRQEGKPDDSFRLRPSGLKGLK